MSKSFKYGVSTVIILIAVIIGGFRFFEKILPMPKPVKKQILDLLAYILCM